MYIELTREDDTKILIRKDQIISVQRNDKGSASITMKNDFYYDVKEYVSEVKELLIGE